MYTLYYAPGLASMAPHFVLREAGAPYELVLVDRSKNEQKSPAYLALNPNARIPTFVDGEEVLFEAAAICLHLAERHPEARLLPVDPTARSHAYKWLVFLTNTLQSDLWHYYRPEFYVGEPAFGAYRARMADHIAGHFGVLDAALAHSIYLAGPELSLPDLYLLMLGRWARALPRTARSFPHVSRVLDSLLERPALREVFEIEGLEAPYL